MGVLLMLMTIAGLIAATILLAIALSTGKTWLRNFVLGGVAVWFAFYAAMLFGLSLNSEEKSLALNEPKEFCGFYLDCHMHAAVTNVRRTKTIGERRSSGEFFIVTVKVFSNAKRASLGLVSVNARVIDEKDRSYTRDVAAEAELGAQPEFETRIGPADTFEKKIVYDLPSGIVNPRLDIREGYGIDRVIEVVLIGDEDSFFHARNYWALSVPPAVVGGLTLPTE